MGKSFRDGYNPLQGAYSGLLTYGGRGWSLIDADTMQRVYDSGDILETFYQNSSITDQMKAVYNSMYTNPGDTQSSSTDRASPLFGPTQRLLLALTSTVRESLQLLMATLEDFTYSALARAQLDQR